MIVTIDKDTKDVSKLKKNKELKLLYIFNDEPLKQLLKTKLHCIKYNCDIYADVNLTSYKIDSLRKTIEKPQQKDYKIGIIIPNYNYEHTIEKCLTSILNQTYKNFEIVFVDDCSDDNSVKIAKSLLKLPHKVIKLKQKRFNGGARNEGYLHLSDDVDYVWYVDSDDWLDNNNVLEDINNHLQSYPDVLFVGMAQYKGGNKTISSIPNYNDKYEAMNGWSGSCSKVIKKELATRQECLYNEGTLKEDKNQHCKICIYMNSFELLKKPVYIWNRDNTKSVTTRKENIDWKVSTIRHYADILELYMKTKGKDYKIDKIMEERIKRQKKEVEKGGDKQW